MIDFVQHPEIALPIKGKGHDPAAYGPEYRAVYKYDYPAIFRAVAEKKLDSVGAYRQLIKDDLFFIAYFVAGWDDGKSSGNKPFIVNQCRLIEEGPQTGTVDVWSREHGKSACITIAGTVKRIVNDPESTTAIFSFKKPAAEKFLDSIRKILELPIMVQCFPDILYSNPSSMSPSWSLQGGIRVNRNNTTRREHTVEAFGLVEGMPIGGHFDHRIYDDVETDDMAQNPDQLDLCYKKLMMSRALGREGGTERIIGTYYSHCGVLVKLQNTKDIFGNDKYQLRVYPATHDGTLNGEPVFFSQGYLDDKKIDQDSFSTQYLCNPTPSHEIKLMFDQFRPIEPQFLPKKRIKFVIVDPAGDDTVQKGNNNDSWAMVCVSVNPQKDELGNSQVYLEDIISDQMGLSEAIDAACQLYMRNGRIQQIGVEKVANDTTYEHIRKALKAKGRHITIKAGGKKGNMVLLSPSGRGKNRRIESALSWPLSNGKLFYSTSINSELIGKIRKEMELFPYFHVDILDALAYLYDLLKDFDFSDFEGAAEQPQAVVEDYDPLRYAGVNE